MSHISAAMAGSVLALAIVSEGHAYIHAINMNAQSNRIMDVNGGDTCGGAVAPRLH